MTPEFTEPCVPGDDEWHRRLEAFLGDDSEWEWWWLSFVDTDAEYTPEGDYPGGPRFLGIAIVPAPNIVVAARIAHAFGCNPGGEVAAYPAVPPGWAPKADYIFRLFAGDEGRRLGTLELHEFALQLPPKEAADAPSTS